MQSTSTLPRVSLSKPSASKGLAVVAALAAVYVLWGSTAPAIKVAVHTVPPFSLAALRFLCAGGLLWFWARARGSPLPSAREWRGAALSGTILLVVGNGVFSWCLVSIPAGVGALILALTPIWNALIGASFYRERLRWPSIAGILIGFGGMAFLISPSGAERLPVLPTALAIVSSLAWSVGSMIQRRYPATDVVQMSGAQMLVGFGVLAVIALLAGEHLTAAEFTPAAIGALAFLIVFGSIVGFSAFIWVTRNVPTVLASTYSYVNPVVALTIAVLLLHEPLTWHVGAGALTVIAGVALMLFGESRS